MIVSKVPRPIHALRSIALPLAILFAWDIAVTVAYFVDDRHFGGLAIPVTLFGSAIALFVGFMVNAAYGRWWEARTLWGQIVNSSRSLARQALVLVDEPADVGYGARGEMIRSQVAYVHVLRTSLRRQDMPAEAAAYLEDGVLERVRAATNKPTAVLTALDEAVTDAARDGLIGELSRLRIEDTLVDLTDAQGGLERIKNTPLPVQYRFLPRVFARLFCVILPFAVVPDLAWWTPIGSGLVGLMFLLAVQIGDELAEPFVDGVNDIPMTQLCRTIEIDLVEMMGAQPPAPVEPVDRVLW